MSITAYYAMADGKVIDDPTIKAIAAAHGKTEAQVVLRWLIQQDGVVTLSKTISEERAKSNFEIFRAVGRRNAGPARPCEAGRPYRDSAQPPPEWSSQFQ